MKLILYDHLQFQQLHLLVLLLCLQWQKLKVCYYFIIISFLSILFIPLQYNVTLIYFVFTVNAVSANTFKDLQLDVRNTDMLSIVRAMARLDSGLEIRDRMWLKIVIPNSFIGM